MRPTSATGAERARGFSLVELMVVLVVMGLAAAAVATTLPPRTPALDSAEQLGMHLRRAREEALLGTRTVELVADPSGYRFRRRGVDRWDPLPGRAFAPRAWAPGVRLVLPAGQQQESVRFDAIGGAQARQFTLADADDAFNVSVDATGQVEIDGASH